MIQYLSFAIFLVLLLLAILFSWFDRLKKRTLKKVPKISFVTACYNDGDSVEETIKSIYAIVPDADVVVVNDHSTDNSYDILKDLQKKYGFRLFSNERNMGKAATLNNAYKYARNDIIVFVDTDVIVNKKALYDALARLQDDKVGAVSCPYIPRNSGFVPIMQHIEYNMLSLVQGSYNIFSAIALWGGFIVTKKRAFEAAGGFSVNAITEDMDLAFKLNERGWKVEQSFYPVETIVPSTFSSWFKQKIRWSAGAVQCFVNHYRVWIRNPLHVFFLFSYFGLTIVAFVSVFRSIIFFDQVRQSFIFLHHYSNFFLSLELTSLIYGLTMIRSAAIKLGFTLFSLPYVIPLITLRKDINYAWLAVPFSLIYIPLFMIASVAGAVHFAKRYKKLRRGERAW